MFKLFNLDLEFFNLAARFLICFASTASILKAGFTQFLETLYPRVDLLVAYIMLDGNLTIIAAICQTFLDDLNALLFGGFSRCSHTASS